MARPLKFGSREDLQERIEAYFASCAELNEPLSITGLALALGTSRQTLMDYQKREEYADIIERAKTQIEYSYEQRLIRMGKAGDIFALKQFGWHDRPEACVPEPECDERIIIRVDYGDEGELEELRSELLPIPEEDG